MFFRNRASYCMKKGIVFVILLGVLVGAWNEKAWAQRTVEDSLAANRIQAASLLIPVGMIASGTIIHVIEEHHELNLTIRDEVQGWEMNKIKLDDYIQYLPCVAFAAMNFTNIERKGSRGDNLTAIPLAYLFVGAGVLSVKEVSNVLRPDGSTHNSFPSGHTANAFLGAELLRDTYWETSPFYGIAAYTVAASVGFLRIYNDRHWFADVIAGAGFGILAARLAIMFAPYVSSALQNTSQKLSKWTKNLTLAPMTTGKQFGLALNLSF